MKYENQLIIGRIKKGRKYEYILDDNSIIYYEDIKSKGFKEIENSAVEKLRIFPI